MAISLPTAIAAYFVADASKSAEEVANCFVETASVTDEGNRYSGREDIHVWKDSSSKKFEYTVEPFDIRTEGGRIAVTSHLTGNFPGSPIDLRYLFVLDGDLISELEITL